MQLCKDKSRSPASRAKFIYFYKRNILFLVLLFGTFRNEQNSSTTLFGGFVIRFYLPSMYKCLYMYVGLSVVYYLFMYLFIFLFICSVVDDATNNANWLHCFR